MSDSTDNTPGPAERVIDERTIYERLGGRETIERVVDRFYGIMAVAPEATAVRATHPEALAESASKLKDFLTGWAGGPPVYIQKYGHPRLRARHMPFAIGARERDEWLWCMSEALKEVGVEADTARLLMGAFTRIAAHMQNRHEAVPT